MNLYQVFEITNQGKSMIFCDLELKNADKLAIALGDRHSKNTYGFEPMGASSDKNYVDFSNQIMEDIEKEGIPDHLFLDNFLERKKLIKQAVKDMIKDAKKRDL